MIAGHARIFVAIYTPAQWPLKDRMRVVLRAEGLEDEALGALLREEGITTADLEAWRKVRREQAA